MAIKIVTGKPGSGKTYFAVSHLANEYCDKNTCTLKDETVQIITNIDSLQLPHLKLEHCLKESNQTIQTFFTVPFQEKISKKYPKIVYFIDEAQQFFDSKFYNKEVFYYFQTHRHLGHDIYLITQAIKLLPFNINQLAEREIRAQPRSVSIFGEFKYYVFVSGESVDRFALKKKQRIFDLYKSMDVKEHEKLNNPFMKYLALLGVFMVLAGTLFYYVFLRKIDKYKNITEPEKINTEIVNQSSNNYQREIKHTKANTKKTTNNEYRIKLNYCIVDNKSFYYDPELNQMAPIQDFPYPIQIIKRGSNLQMIATVPEHFANLHKSMTKRGEGLSALSPDQPPIQLDTTAQ